MSLKEMDELLGEYMRVINHKDSEICELTARCERLQTEHRKEEDCYKMKLAELRQAVFQLQQAHKENVHLLPNGAVSSDKYESLKLERDNLASDVATLRAALQRHEDHLKGVLKTSNRTQKKEEQVREKLETELSTLRAAHDGRHQQLLDRIAVLETQNETLQARISESSTDSSHWKLEVSRLEDQLKERDGHIRELRKRLKHVVGKDEIAAEVQELTARHEAETSSLQQEIRRLRETASAEAGSNSRKDAVVAQLRTELDRLQREVTASRRHMDERRAEERAALERRAEDFKAATEGRLIDARQQLANAAAEVAQRDAHITELRHRLEETEATLQQRQRLWQDTEADLEHVNHSLKLKAAETQREYERVLAQHQESLARDTVAAVERTRTEYNAEVRHLQDDLERARQMAMRTSEGLAEAESTISELRKEITLLRCDQTKERHEFTLRAREQEEALQTKEAERRALILQTDEKLRDEKRSFASVLQENEIQKKTISSLHIRLSEVLEELQRRERLIDQLNEAIAAGKIREEQGASNRKDLDAKLLQLDMAMAEKDTANMALRRAVESANTSLVAVQAQVDSLRSALTDEQAQHEHSRRDLATVRAQLQKREDDVEAYEQRLRRAETALKQAARDHEGQLMAMKERMRVSAGEIEQLQSSILTLKADKQNLESRHLEQMNAMQRDSIAPLEEKIITLTGINQRTSRELQERETTISHLREIASDVQNKTTKVENLTDEVTRLRESLYHLQQKEKEMSQDREQLRKLKFDNEAMTTRLTSVEMSLEHATRELAELHKRELELTTQLSHKSAENSTLAERNANLDSLRTIAEQQVRESQHREHELMEKLEETRTAHGVLQACFERQQEQLEAGRRMREHDLQVREQNVSPYVRTPQL